MTTQTTTQLPTQRSAPRSLRSLCTTTIGALLVVTGAAHAVTFVVGNATSTPPNERAVRALMAATSVPVAGVERSYWQLFQGFSLMMALMLVALGSLVLLVQRTAPEVVRSTRAVQTLLLVVLVPALAISVLLLPPPPVIMLGMACVAAVIALLAQGVTRPESGGTPAHLG